MHPPALDTKPSNLDWARYLGPIKWRDYDPQQYYNFRAYLDFGGGQITDLFTHWIDVVHMFMEQDNPIAAVASGGVYNYKDGRTAPDTIYVPARVSRLSGRPRLKRRSRPASRARPSKWSAPKAASTSTAANIATCRPSAAPSRSWSRPRATWSRTTSTISWNACASRKRPNGDVWIGHRSAQASHLGNLAYLQKRRIKFDPDREEILPL